jgi:hypothetical protein
MGQTSMDKNDKEVKNAQETSPTNEGIGANTHKIEQAGKQPQTVQDETSPSIDAIKNSTVSIPDETQPPIVPDNSSVSDEEKKETADEDCT